MRMYKNGGSLKLTSMVNFILGCKFWSKLYKSLILPQKHFQNTKKSFRYLFYDLMISVFIFLLYYFLIIPCRFSSKRTKFTSAYAGALLVPFSVSMVCMWFLFWNWKELFKISFILSLINLLLNLESNFSEYFLYKMRWALFHIPGGYHYIVLENYIQPNTFLKKKEHTAKSNSIAHIQVVINIHTEINPNKSTIILTLTFGQIPLGKVWTPLSSQLWVK